MHSEKMFSPYDRLITRNGGKIAVFSDGRAYTYRDLDALVSRFSSFLRQKGIGPGEIVLLSVFDSVEFIAAFLSCVRSGIVVAPFDPRISGEDLDHILAGVSPRGILSTENVCRMRRRADVIKIADDDSSGFFLSLVKDQVPDRSPSHVPNADDPAFILFTSGTTGKPKGAVHRCADVLLDTYPREILRLTSRDVVFSCSPAFTSYGLGNSLVFPFQAGAKVVLSRRPPDPWSVEQAMRLKPTVFCAVPSVYELLLGYRDVFQGPFKRVRLFVVAGEKLSPELFARWGETYGAPLLEHYGASEMFHPIASNVPGRERINSCGRPVPGFDVRFDAKGRVGFAGPTLCTGYCGQKELTKKRMRGGYFRSDDIGYRDRDGYVFITGRDGLVLKVHGRWVPVGDVENEIRRIDGVRDAAAARTGNRLDYYVSLKDGAAPARVEKEIRRHFAGTERLHLVPRRVVFLKVIPRTRSGKVMRRKLNEVA